MNISGELLVQYIQRIERLEEEKSEAVSFIKDVYSEVKNEGFCPKVVREIVKQRKLDRQALEEQEQLMELYKHAIGMI